MRLEFPTDLGLLVPVALALLSLRLFQLARRTGGLPEVLVGVYFLLVPLAISLAIRVGRFDASDAAGASSDVLVTPSCTSSKASLPSAPGASASSTNPRAPRGTSKASASDSPLAGTTACPTSRTSSVAGVSGSSASSPHPAASSQSSAQSRLTHPR